MIRTEVEITSDGKTVWVNAPTGCIGRFSKSGVDVHKLPEEQVSSGAQCLDCSPAPDWERFKASMLKFHGVEVGDEHRPEVSDGR